jgi:hypothetical protein
VCRGGPKLGGEKRKRKVTESHCATAHPLSLNLEIRDLQRQYPADLGTTVVPHPRLKSDWKALINSIAEAAK